MKTPEERKRLNDAYAAKVLRDLPEKMKQEALAYQKDQQSTNERSMMNALNFSDLVGKPLLTEQLDWMKELFALQVARSKDPSNTTPFESVGNKPHSFNELYAEKWNL